MPELPEVEAIARTLRPLVVGRKIRCVHAFHPVAVKPQTATALARAAEGKTIRSVERHGKFLLLGLNRGLILLHFRFDGRLIWFLNAKALLTVANAALDDERNSVHVDIAFELDRGVLGFADRRHFGKVHYAEDRKSSPSLRALGVDAFSPEFNEKLLFDLVSKSKQPVKEFLLNQSRIAGIGNIYSGEALWTAKIDPGRPANTLTRAEAKRLHKAIVSVLERALECCLEPSPEFRDPNWWFQGIENILRVYQREGQPCQRCGELVKRMAQGGRSTYYCARCQK